MIKDLTIAIIFGAILGLAVTTGFYTITKNNKNSSVIPTPTETLSPTPIESNQSSTIKETNSDLNIELPLNESVSTTAKITIKGTSKPNNILIINTPLETYTSTIDESGSFAVEVELDSGANVIKISAIDSNDNQTNAELLVTYSSAKF